MSLIYTSYDCISCASQTHSFILPNDSAFLTPGLSACTHFGKRPDGRGINTVLNLPLVLYSYSSNDLEQAPQQASRDRVSLSLPPDYNRVEISYCTGCRWMLRAAWLAQELLTTFQDEVQEVAIQPVKDPAGTFEVRLNNRILFDRKAQGRFPEVKEIKQLVRDVVDPARNLGHSDKKESAF